MTSKARLFYSKELKKGIISKLSNVFKSICICMTGFKTSIIPSLISIIVVIIIIIIIIVI